jgi:hypothetical protein
MTSGRTSICRCERGVTAIEFAALLPVLLTLIMGGMELGYRLYAVGVLNGVLRDAARMASTGQYSESEIDGKVKGMLSKFRGNATVTIYKKSYAEFSGVGAAEPIVSGSMESGEYCFQDVNDNGQWDADQGSNGLGNPDDVVHYEVEMQYGTLFPFTRELLKMNKFTLVEANTLMSNEPFAPPSDFEPKTKCV